MEALVTSGDAATSVEAIVLPDLSKTQYAAFRLADKPRRTPGLLRQSRDPSLAIPMLAVTSGLRESSGVAPTRAQPRN